MLRARISVTRQENKNTVTLTPDDSEQWSFSSELMKRSEKPHLRWNIRGWFVPDGLQDLLSQCDGGTLLVAGEFCIYCGSGQYAEFSFDAVCVKDKEGNVVLPELSEPFHLCNRCGCYGTSGLIYGVNSLHRATNICSRRGTAQIQDEIDKYSNKAALVMGRELEYAKKYLKQAEEDMGKARKRAACDHHWVEGATPCVDSQKAWFSIYKSRTSSDSSKPCESSIFFASEERFYDAVFPLLFLPGIRRGYWSTGGEWDASTHGKAFEMAMRDGGKCWAELVANQKDLIKKAVHPTYDPDPVKEILKHHGYLTE